MNLFLPILPCEMGNIIHFCSFYDVKGHDRDKDWTFCTKEVYTSQKHAENMSECSLYVLLSVA